MKHNFEKTLLFSFPIYKIRIDPNSYDKEKILSDIKYNKSLKTSRNPVPIGEPAKRADTHHSYNQYDDQFISINYDKLNTTYVETYDEFFNNILYTEDIAAQTIYKYRFKIVNYSAMTEGQSLSRHEHHDCDFSTIHYLNFKHDHTPTTFYNPSSYSLFLRKLQPDLSKILADHADNSYFWDYYLFPVEEDDMVIFPASLKHEVYPQGPIKEPRITLSSNIEILCEDRKTL